MTRTVWFGDHGALVRSVRTFAQTAIAMIGVDTFSSWSGRWHDILLTAGTAAVLSLLMSLDAPFHDVNHNNIDDSLESPESLAAYREPAYAPPEPLPYAPPPEPYPAVPAPAYFAPPAAPPFADTPHGRHHGTDLRG